MLIGRFGVLSIAMLFAGLLMGGCENESKATSANSNTEAITLTRLMERKAPQEKIYDLNDFKLRQDLSARRLLHEVGPPHQYVDQGVTWMVYHLDGERQLWLLFSQPGFEHLKNAFEKKLHAGRLTEKMLFSVKKNAKKTIPQKIG